MSESKTKEEIKTLLRLALAEWSATNAHQQDCAAHGESMHCCIDTDAKNEHASVVGGAHSNVEAMLDFLAGKMAPPSREAFLASIFVETPTPCSNCKTVAHVTSEERGRGKWTCYSCGAINRFKK
jgi:hypothetical protein